MKANDDLIGLMVQETLNLTDSADSAIDLKQSVPFSVNLFLDEGRSCYVIHNGKGVLEIPVNWGPFKNRISKQIVISKKDDKDYFIDVLTAFFHQEFQTVQLSIQKIEQIPFWSAAS